MKSKFVAGPTLEKGSVWWVGPVAIVLLCVLFLLAFILVPEGIATKSTPEIVVKELIIVVDSAENAERLLEAMKSFMKIEPTEEEISE